MVWEEPTWPRHSLRWSLSLLREPTKGHEVFVLKVQVLSEYEAEPFKREKTQSDKAHSVSWDTRYTRNKDHISACPVHPINRGSQCSAFQKCCNLCTFASGSQVSLSPTWEAGPCFCSWPSAVQSLSLSPCNLLSCFPGEEPSPLPSSTPLTSILHVHHVLA